MTLWLQLTLTDKGKFEQMPAVERRISQGRIANNRGDVREAKSRTGRTHVHILEVRREWNGVVARESPY
jgi:hypothetical protein